MPFGKSKILFWIFLRILVGKPNQRKFQKNDSQRNRYYIVLGPIFTFIFYTLKMTLYWKNHESIFISREKNQLIREILENFACADFLPLGFFCRTSYPANHRRNFFFRGGSKRPPRMLQFFSGGNVGGQGGK